MKLIFIVPIPPPINGCSIANRTLLAQLKNLPNLVIDVIDTNSENISSSQVGSFSLKKIMSFLGSYREIFSITRANVIYTTPGQTFFGIAKYIPFYLIAMTFSKPYIIHLHGNHLGNEYQSLTGIKKLLFGYFIKQSAAGIVLSKTLRSNFAGLLPDNKIHEVANFAENFLLSTTTYAKPKDKLRLLYLSNLMKEKGILDFIEAIEILQKKNIEFEAHIAGKIEDELGDSLKKKLDSLGDVVTYHGVVQGESKKQLLLQANVFVMPTYYRMEGQPIAILEAMATKNIILTTNYSGIPDIVSADNGYFISPRNPGSIVNALLEIHKHLDELVEKIGNHNATYIKNNFTEEVFAQKVLNVINEVSRAK